MKFLTLICLIFIFDQLDLQDIVKIQPEATVVVEVVVVDVVVDAAVDVVVVVVVVAAESEKRDPASPATNPTAATSRTLSGTSIVLSCPSVN